MEIKSLLNKAQELAGSAGEASSKMLDEFNSALRTMKSLGFSVHDLKMGMGVLPEVHSKLIANADDVDPKALEEMIEKKKDERTLVALLKALQTAYNVRGQLGDLGLEGVEIDLTLGIPPKIGIGFLKKANATT